MNTFNHEGIYQCICGKTFTKSQSFNAHKSQCRQHLLSKYGDDDSVNRVIHRANNNGMMSIEAQKRHNNAIERKKLQLEQWISEQHTCERCGKVMTEYYGSGRFCSRKCANSKPHSNESKAKISNTLKNTCHNKDYSDIYKNKTYFSYIDGNDVIVKLKDIDFCEDGWIPGNLKRRYNIRQTIKNTIGDYAIEQLRYESGYLHGRRSYAEMFWKSVLDNNNISYIEQYPVKSLNKYGMYRLDFYIEDKRLDLEIDGELHELCEDKDVQRTEYLQSLGIQTYRIKWVNPNNDKRSLIVKQQIDDFIAYLNAL